MNFMSQIHSVFNFPTALLVLGMVAAVAGVWIMFGLGAGLVAIGAALIATALIMNENRNEGR